MLAMKLTFSGGDVQAQVKTKGKYILFKFFIIFRILEYSKIMTQPINSSINTKHTQTHICIMEMLK